MNKVRKERWDRWVQGASLDLLVPLENGARQARVDLKEPKDLQEKGVLQGYAAFRELMG